MTQEYVQMLRDALEEATAGHWIARNWNDRDSEDVWYGSTKHESLQEAMQEAASYYDKNHVRTGTSHGAERVWDYCDYQMMKIIEDALAAPIPPAPLRPMSEAPRDGEDFLGYIEERGKLYPEILWSSNGILILNEDGEGVDLNKYVGWHPLPKVEAAIQAAEVQG